MKKGIPHEFGDSKAEQLEAEMELENSSNFATFVEFLPQHKCVAVTQAQRRTGIVFVSPTHLREVAKLMVKAAEYWEQNGMPKEQG